MVGKSPAARIGNVQRQMAKPSVRPNGPKPPAKPAQAQGGQLQAVNRPAKPAAPAATKPAQIGQGAAVGQPGMPKPMPGKGGAGMPAPGMPPPNQIPPELAQRLQANLSNAMNQGYPKPMGDPMQTEQLPAPPQRPAWMQLREAGQMGTGSAAGNRAAVAQMGGQMQEMPQLQGPPMNAGPGAMGGQPPAAQRMARLQQMMAQRRGSGMNEQQMRQLIAQSGNPGFTPGPPMPATPDPMEELPMGGLQSMNGGGLQGVPPMGPFGRMNQPGLERYFQNSGGGFGRY